MTFNRQDGGINTQTTKKSARDARLQATNATVVRYFSAINFSAKSLFRAVERLYLLKVDI
jgi:hypothetical protein